jgi:catechol 2,3-dioxygenase
MMSERMRIGPPTLRIRNIDTVLAFYENMLGLQAKKRYQDRDQEQGKDNDRNSNLFYELGFKNKESVSSSDSHEPLIILKHDATARIPSPRSAGLFHFAILVPDRRSLASTYIALRNSGVQYDGFADHLVSESLYFRDPENNGIEIYRDRPSSEWPRDNNGNIMMDTLPLDLNSLLSEMSINDNEEKDNAKAFPTGAKIGHMHLKVTNLKRSIKFYKEKIGLDITVDWSSMGATFLSAGGRYHHHIAINTWYSLNGESHIIGQDAGLESFTLITPDNSYINGLAQRIYGSPFSSATTNSRQATGNQILVSDPDKIQFMIRSGFRGTKIGM